MALLPALISAGTALLTRNSKTTTESTIDLKKLRKQAKANGFNPLTVLRHGAGGFTSTTSGPRMSTAAFLGDALSAGINTFYNQKDREQEREINNLNKQILEEQLSDLRDNAAIVKDRNFGYSIPHVVSDSKETYGESPALYNGRYVPTGPDLRIANTPVLKDPGFSDTQEIEDRYGDLMSWPYGMAVAGVDFARTVIPKMASWRMYNLAKESAREHGRISNPHKRGANRAYR